MASQAGTSTDSVAFFTKLENEAYRFDFFQALRRIEALYPDKPGLGRSSRLADDPVRLGQEPTLKFAPATLAGFEQGRDGLPDRLSTYFFGMFGPNGALPTHLTEYALQRKLNEEDPTFSRFADLFHHRMLSFLYRAWADARPTVQFDRPDTDRFSIYVGSLFGMGSRHLRDRSALDDKVKLYYAGILAAQTRNAEGLCLMLHDFLRVPAAISEFEGAWMQLPEDCRLRLGVSRETSSLGHNAVAGATVWGCQQKFRILLGPMDLASLRRLLPGGESLKRMIVLVRSYVGDEKDWDVKIILFGEEIPKLELGKFGQLGWTTWLHSDQQRKAAVDDVVLTPMRYAGLAERD